MKIILVTSDLTYAPENYNDVFEFVLRGSRRHIAGVVLVRIGRLDILAKLPYLYAVGCRNIANALARGLGDALVGRKKRLLRKLEIPFISAKSINDKKAVLWLRSAEADLILNMRARCIYDEAVLEIPRLGCVNVHHGILPGQIGLFCDLYALGDNRRTGFTIHKMTGRIDQGQILYQEKVNGSKNYIHYLKEVALKEKTAIVRFIERMARDNFSSKELPDANDRRIVSTSPDLKAIKQLQRKGIIL